jgi:hypothetical protein
MNTDIDKWHGLTMTYYESGIDALVSAERLIAELRPPAVWCDTFVRESSYPDFIQTKWKELDATIHGDILVCLRGVRQENERVADLVMYRDLGWNDIVANYAYYNKKYQTPDTATTKGRKDALRWVAEAINDIRKSACSKDDLGMAYDQNVLAEMSALKNVVSDFTCFTAVDVALSLTYAKNMATVRETYRAWADAVTHKQYGEDSSTRNLKRYLPWAKANAPSP